jgi:hypothetical protein
MGTCYYFYRTDNETLFDMDKAYGLTQLIGTGSDPAKLEDIDAAIDAWYEQLYRGDGGDIAMNKADDLKKAVREFAGHQTHLYFISEHHQIIDALYDNGRDVNKLTTHDRFLPPPFKRFPL